MARLRRGGREKAQGDGRLEQAGDFPGGAVQQLGNGADVQPQPAEAHRRAQAALFGGVHRA